MSEGVTIQELETAAAKLVKRWRDGREMEATYAAFESLSEPVKMAFLGRLLVFVIGDFRPAPGDTSTRTFPCPFWDYRLVQLSVRLPGGWLAYVVEGSRGHGTRLSCLEEESSIKVDFRREVTMV